MREPDIDYTVTLPDSEFSRVVLKSGTIIVTRDVEAVKGIQQYLDNPLLPVFKTTPVFECKFSDDGCLHKDG